MQNTILFDLDGTLIDSTEAILESFEVAYSVQKTQKPSIDKILSLIGHPLSFMFEHLGVPKNRVDDFVNSYKNHYRTISRAKTVLLPNAKDALIEAKKFAKLGVVTTKTARYSKELLIHLEVMNFFETLIGFEDVINPKPDPEPILKAMHHLNAIPEKTWMIGDTCLDIISANQSEIKSVAVSCGYGKLEELERCTSHIKDNSFEAVKFIQSYIFKSKEIIV
ncbi:MAG: HAD hydrolase-like protein [Campylobacterales bacterium]|nr:HAD hydrolase-like protein [Campylobacterales bacterium]